MPPAIWTQTVCNRFLTTLMLWNKNVFWQRWWRARYGKSFRFFFITFTIIIIWSLCQPTAGYRSLWHAMQYYQMQLFSIMFDIFPSSAYLIWGRRSASPWPYKTGRVPVHLSSVHRGHSHLLLYEWRLLPLFCDLTQVLRIRSRLVLLWYPTYTCPYLFSLLAVVDKCSKRWETAIRCKG